MDISCQFLRRILYVKPHHCLIRKLCLKHAIRSHHWITQKLIMLFYNFHCALQKLAISRSHRRKAEFALLSTRGYHAVGNRLPWQIFLKYERSRLDYWIANTWGSLPVAESKIQKLEGWWIWWGLSGTYVWKWPSTCVFESVGILASLVRAGLIQNGHFPCHEHCILSFMLDILVGINNKDTFSRESTMIQVGGLRDNASRVCM